MGGGPSKSKQLWQRTVSPGVPGSACSACRTSGADASPASGMPFSKNASRRRLSLPNPQAARAALSDFRRTHEPAALAEARDALGPERWETVVEFEGGREGGFA